MSLQTAIVALTPALYWRLNEPFAATTVADSAGGAFPGTVVGDISLGTFGPEIDRTSARIFTGGQIVSPAWGASVWNSFSVMFMASAPFDGTAGSQVPVIGLGDPANPATKFKLAITSGAPNNGGWGMVPGTGTSILTNVTQPFQNWHHVTFVYTSSPVNKQLYVDGVVGTASATTLTPVPAVGDRWFIQSNVPVIVSDMAVFSRALTQVEIQSVSNLVQKWYAQVPINSPVPIEGGQIVVNPPTTDLTPVLTQTTQILNNQSVYQPVITTDVPLILGTTNVINGKTTTIQTDTQNMVNTLFPQLATVINDIGAQVNDVANAVIGSIIEGGETIVKTVGELLSPREHKDLVDVSYSGGPTCSPIFKDISEQRVYGITVRITAYPTDWKFRTPDNAWSLKDLAVLRLYHNGDLVLRHGIHTITHVVEPIPQRGLPWIWGTTPLQNPGTVVTLDFAEGVCGELIGNESST